MAKRKEQPKVGDTCIVGGRADAWDGCVVELIEPYSNLKGFWSTRLLADWRPANALKGANAAFLVDNLSIIEPWTEQLRAIDEFDLLWNKQL